MTTYLEYKFVNGFVHNWLTAGPRALPIENVKNLPEKEAGERQWVYQSLPADQRTQMLDLTVSPLEMVAIDVGDTKQTWRYYRCQDDHLVDLSASFPLWNYLSAWAYSIIKLPESQKAVFVLTASGPVDLWLNRVHIQRFEDFNIQEPSSYRIEVDLQEGENQVLVHFEMVGVRECPFSFALQVTGLAEEIDKKAVIMVPTQARFPRRHEILEAAFEKAYLEEVVNHRGAHFNLRWAEDIGTKTRYEYQIQDKDKFSYVDGAGETDPNKPNDVGHSYRIKERQLYVTVRPVLLEYFDHNLRYEKKFPIYVIDNLYASASTNTLGERNREALEDASKYDNNLFAELAKLRLGRWADFKPDVVVEHIQKVNRLEADSDVYLLGLLGMMYRYMNDPNFPEHLKQPLTDSILNFKYWQDEGIGAFRLDGLDYKNESHQILFHACEVLAGQLYPRHTFTNSGKKGLWQRKKGEQLALEWLRLRGTQGFQLWDSNDSFEKNLLAFSHLTSLTKDVALRELAAVMMDKTFFSMAVNSYKGSFGSTHGHTSASMLKSAQLEATSGISRVMWGSGVFNSHILGTVSLASSDYEFPLLIGDIASDVVSKVWNRERHVVDSETGADVNKVTYKTPDYMLCSAQDYRPGERGVDEHIWQATLGPDAVVFVNHPACLSETEEHRPGFWLGNRSLPRVAQWKDVLIAVHHLPDNDWLGFTHAYFPIHKFSEYEIRKNHQSKGEAWAFARKDDGYLALTASQGFELIRNAPDGYRELRSYGQNNIWLCHMGSAETDGSFETFKKRMLALRPGWQGLEVSIDTLRGEHLSFGWDSPLLIDGQEQTIRDFKHYESQYCEADLPANQMDIQSQGTVMRLNFS